MVPTSIAFFERGGSASRPPKMCTKTFSRYFSLRISASKTRSTSGAGSSVSLPIVASSTTGRPPRSGRLLCRMSRSMNAFALWREILASRRRTSTKPRDLGICGRSLTGAAGMHLPFLCGGILNGGNCRNGAIEPVDGARAPEKSSSCSEKTLSKGAL